MGLSLSRPVSPPTIPLLRGWTTLSTMFTRALRSMWLPLGSSIEHIRLVQNVRATWLSMRWLDPPLAIAIPPTENAGQDPRWTSLVPSCPSLPLTCDDRCTVGLMSVDVMAISLVSAPPRLLLVAPFLASSPSALPIPSVPVVVILKPLLVAFVVAALALVLLALVSAPLVAPLVSVGLRVVVLRALLLGPLLLVGVLLVELLAVIAALVLVAALTLVLVVLTMTVLELLLLLLKMTENRMSLGIAAELSVLVVLGDLAVALVAVLVVVLDLIVAPLFLGLASAMLLLPTLLVPPAPALPTFVFALTLLHCWCSLHYRCLSCRCPPWRCLLCCYL